jgi:acetone carboxylase beta subunit
LTINKAPQFAGHKLRLPMVMSNSIGAGCGSIIRVDKVTKRITLGPESAGSDVGTCYNYPDITIADIDVILGYLNPENFLGGKIILDKDEALARLKRELADPLGKDVYEVGSQVLDMLHASMCDEINAMVTSKGLNTREFTLMVYGGSGPLHAWGMHRGGLKCAETITAPWAAAMSAFGCAAAEYFHRYDKSVTFLYAHTMPDEVKMMQAGILKGAWDELEKRAYEELGGEGYSKDKIYFRYGISARYIGQISTWDAPVVKGSIENLDDLQEVLDCFENVYTTIYPIAARYPEIGYQITEVYLEAGVDKIKPKIPSYELKGKTPPEKASKGQRDCYIDGQWFPFDIWDMDSLEAGNRVDGPAIIEHMMSTWVIPPEEYVDIDERKFMYHKQK